MKILFLTNKLPFPPKDGGSIATLNMIRGLSQAGLEVTCLSLNTKKHHFPIAEIPGSLSEKIRFLGVDCNASLRPVKMAWNLFFSKTPYIAERFNSAAFASKLTELLDREEFDVVQLEGPYLGHYIKKVRSKSRALISFRAHNVEHRIWERKAAGEKKAHRRWYLKNMAHRLKGYEEKVARESDVLVCISPLDRTVFTEMGISKPSITIPTGLEMKEYPFSDLPGDFSVSFIGALDWMPNQEGLKWFLDHVLDPLRRDLPGISFHVAGRNAPSHVEKMLAKKQVIYHGEIEDARAFMQAYRVMVAPLFTGSGIRIKILEAMALGRPVITTPVGIEGIAAKDNQHTMISRDPEEFKNQIIKLCRNEEFAREMAREGRKLIQENFDTFGLSTRIKQFFKEQV